MGVFAALSTVVTPNRLRADGAGVYAQAFFSGSEFVPDPAWFAGGSHVPADVALTLSYVYSAVDIISSDFGTMTCHLFEDRGHDDKRRVAFTDAGVGDLAFRLRWKPNRWQTAKAFWTTLAWQYLLRPACYAEIVYRPGGQVFVDEIIPRHPDRVTQEVLPNGAIRYKLREPGGGVRFVSQDEMFVVRNTSPDGLNALSRLDYGAKAIATGLSLQDYTRAFFSKGASAALLATYKGEMEGPDEERLHQSISRFMGPQNAGGIMLVPEDIDVKALGIDPERSELVGLKNISGRDIARIFKLPPSWLGIEGAQSYNSLIQDSALYVNRVQMPLVVEFEQAIHRDLILAQKRYYAKFNMDYLLRGDTLQRMQSYEIAIRSRVMRPSEARVKEDMNPDAKLDQLSERDFQPGQAAGSRRNETEPASASAGLSKLHIKGLLSIRDNADRCLRRERVAVEKLAKKHANDVPAWQAGLAEFFSEHAHYVAMTMRVPLGFAQSYAETHREAFAAGGLKLIDGEAGEAWQRSEADDLVLLAVTERAEEAA